MISNMCNVDIVSGKWSHWFCTLKFEKCCREIGSRLCLSGRIFLNVREKMWNVKSWKCSNRIQKSLFSLHTLSKLELWFRQGTSNDSMSSTQMLNVEWTELRKFNLFWVDVGASIFCLPNSKQSTISRLSKFALSEMFVWTNIWFFGQFHSFSAVSWPNTKWCFDIPPNIPQRYPSKVRQITALSSWSSCVGGKCSNVILIFLLCQRIIAAKFLWAWKN